MAIEKLTEFAKTGQKNTDDLDLETGFIVNRKPARQWFNWLFNTLTTKINEIIDADFMPKSDVVDNLTTNDATKPISAKQAKLLQDNKLDKTANAASATKLQTARTINGVAFDGTANINLPMASTSTSGTVQLNNTLTSTSTAQALTAAQGKKLQDEKLDKSGGTVTGTLAVNGPLRSKQYIDLGHGESSDENRTIVFYSTGTSKKGQIASSTSGAMEFTGATSYSFDKTVSADISGNAASATNCSRSVVAGNGLSGGGALNANRTLTLGTPGTITASTGNAVSASSHTHDLNIDGFFQGTKSTNGYQRLPGGLILQWGSADAQIAGVTITYPISFPNGVFSVIVTDIATSGTPSNLAVRTRSNNSFVVVGGNNDYFNWFAIGH